MEFIDTVAALDRHYGTPGEASRVKVARRMTPRGEPGGRQADTFGLITGERALD